jgi:hypothetical protein
VPRPLLIFKPYLTDQQLVVNSSLVEQFASLVLRHEHRGD